MAICLFCPDTVKSWRTARTARPNDAAPWPDFDAEGYWKFSCASLLPENAQIIWRARNFLIKAFGDRAPARSAVDVGAGSNLYPALLMLPWTKHIMFTDFAGTNINGLAGNLADAPGGWAWQPCWDLAAVLPRHGTLRSRSLSSPPAAPRPGPRPPGIAILRTDNTIRRLRTGCTAMLLVTGYVAGPLAVRSGMCASVDCLHTCDGLVPGQRHRAVGRCPALVIPFE